MGPLSDENKLQVDEKTIKTEKLKKILKESNINNLMTIRYKLFAMRNIIHSILKQKLR